MTDLNSFKLVIEDDEGRRSVVPIELGEISIGRLEGNTIRLKERNVSRHHARLLKDNAGVIYAEDLDSYNGLWVNGDRIAGRSALRDGDILRIGDFQLELRGDGLQTRRDEATQRTSVLHDNTNPGGRVDETPLTDEPTVTSARLTVPKSPSAMAPPRAVPAMDTDPGVPAPQLTFDEDEPFEPTAIIRLTAEDDGRKNAASGPVPAGQRAKLICVSTGFAGREYELEQAEVVVGRTDENDIGIDHRSISRHHARIVASGRRFKIIDLESANGTLVNGEPYAQTDLKRGDLIELGHVKLRFVPPGESYTLTPEEQAAVHGVRNARAVRSDEPRAAPRPAMFLGIVGLAVAVLFGSIAYLMSAPAEKNTAGSSEVEQLMTQATSAVGQKNWKRAQTMANAVLALEPGREAAQGISRQADVEGRAQHNYDTAVGAIGQSQWSDAWNALQEIPSDSCYYNQAMSLNAQVRPALITEHISDAKEALRNTDYEQAQQLVDEVEGLDASRPEINELRRDIDDGRKHHPTTAPPPPNKAPPKPQHKREAPKMAKAPPPPPPAADDPKNLYVEGTKALTAGQVPKAIESFNRCVVADKNFALCYRAMGIAYARSGNGPKAARYYRLYLKVDPNARDAAQVRQLLQQYESTQ